MSDGAHARAAFGVAVGAVVARGDATLFQALGRIASRSGHREAKDGVAEKQENGG